MNKKALNALENSLRVSFEKILADKSIDELRKIDWLSLHPDFHIQKNNQKKAA